MGEKKRNPCIKLGFISCSVICEIAEASSHTYVESEHLLSAYHVPGTAGSALHILSHLILRTPMKLVLPLILSVFYEVETELTWMVDPRFEPRLPDSTAFNDSVILPLVLVSGLLAAGPASDRVVWTSSQWRGRLVVLGERILPSYSAGSPIHLIRGAPQNLKAFGDSRNVLYLVHIDPINAFWGF